ncbi:MAG: DUF1566 domain-containing protein [Comamonadaceae bacterium]|nr:DUF1566 domain-containing protein [Comamonadaceae bacterium]
MHTLPAQSVFSRLSALRSALTLVSALLLGASVTQAAPTGPLNDTGQTQCANASDVLVACDSAATGDASTRPRQDGRFGRDVASPTKVGGGAAGFDFTPLDASGNAIALTGSPAVPSATPRCVKDNVTNLIWEVKTASPLKDLQDYTYTYAWGSSIADTATCDASMSSCNTDVFITALNAANLCGETANDWRLPTRRELLSIVHNGRTNAPAIDVNYFPVTPFFCWTSDTFADFRITFGSSFFNGGGSTGTTRRLATMFASCEVDRNFALLMAL